MPASWRTFTHAARHCSSVPYCCSNSASVSPCMIARIDPISCPSESILHRFRSGRKGGRLVDKRILKTDMTAWLDGPGGLRRIDDLLWRFHRGRAVPGRLGTPQPSPSAGCDGIIAGAADSSRLASIVVGGKIRGSDCMGDSGSPWHDEHATARPEGMVASAAAHGAMACCGASLRMKISHP